MSLHQGTDPVLLRISATSCTDGRRGDAEGAWVARYCAHDVQLARHRFGPADACRFDCAVRARRQSWSLGCCCQGATPGGTTCGKEVESLMVVATSCIFYKILSIPAAFRDVHSFHLRGLCDQVGRMWNAAEWDQSGFANLSARQLWLSDHRSYILPVEEMEDIYDGCHGTLIAVILHRTHLWILFCWLLLSWMARLCIIGSGKFLLYDKVIS